MTLTATVGELIEHLEKIDPGKPIGFANHGGAYLIGRDELSGIFEDGTTALWICEEGECAYFADKCQYREMAEEDERRDEQLLEAALERRRQQGLQELRSSITREGGVWIITLPD